MSHIILLGNEKGGSGKTTTAMHLIMSLLRMGFNVSSIDLDIRQGSLSRYIENRKLYSKEKHIELTLPKHFHLKDNNNNKELDSIIKNLKNYDFIIIDTPGHDNTLNRYAHYLADTVITPINDSFLDVDLLGKVDPNNHKQAALGPYSNMLWEQKKQKAFTLKKRVSWLVVRNRLSSIDVLNKRNVGNALSALSKRLGFKIVPGFGDRVIFKELFLTGLTLLDAREQKIKLTPSVISARQELREFVHSINESLKLKEL